VRTIYSVIASPNRLDILRILNTRGPLSYSELKTLAGFKSKKESGKFAYHLRKLVKQTLILLNRAERKYIVTSLGRLVLNLTRQIEEQSMLESGKLYVRSSRQAMEEFNADRILQSLVKEAGMPVELAQKIASETEARVYKFQTTYLTAPLIREIVNSILVEHGYEEYRHKLTRLGLPVNDVGELIVKAGDNSESVEYVLAKTSDRVFAEYSILTKIPRDVSDAHLNGDIHISNLGTWSLMPDTLYFDLASLYTNPVNLGSKVSYLPRLNSVKSFDAALETLEVLASVLLREVSSEVCFDNLIPFLSKLYAPRSKEEQVRTFSRLLTTVSTSIGEGSRRIISFHVGEPSKDEDVSSQLELRDSLLDAYTKYCVSVPFPRINLIVNPGKYLDRRVLDAVAQIVSKGGDIALQSEGKFVFGGYRVDSIARNGTTQNPSGLAILHNLTINLPRLAYESNRDETYFRAKLAILLQTALVALSNRKEQVRDSMKRGLLPALSEIPLTNSIEDMPLVINLLGLSDAISSLISEKEASLKHETALKVLETASRVASERASRTGQRAFVSVADGEGLTRLAEIDAEKYSRPQEVRSKSYEVGIVIPAEHHDNQELISRAAALANAATGGCFLRFDFSSQGNGMDFQNFIASVSNKIPFARLALKSEICTKCGTKVFGAEGRCSNCKSTSLIPQVPIS
jgi:ribonucleoside-triphosphate reductase (formate)